MEIFTDFIHNYKDAVHGLNPVAKVLVALALALILFAVASAVVNLVIYTV